MAYDNPRNGEVYHALLQRYQNKGVIPFVGAGMSAAAGFMTWTGFLRDEYAKFMNPKTPPADPLDAAAELFAALDETLFYNDLKNAFGEQYTAAEWHSIKNRMRSEAVGLLPELFRDVVVTTNFDRLLEHLYPSAVPVYYPGRNGQLNRAMQTGRNIIFKLHGCVTDPENIIFTRESYNRAYLPDTGEKTAVISALENILTGQTVLFLGCSLQDDYTVKHWAEMIRQPAGAGIEHFAIINCAPEQRREKRRHLNKMHILPILYDSGASNKKHEAVRIILEQLAIDTGGGKPLHNHNLRPRNDYFTGRADQLNELQNSFAGSPHLTRVITGLGGVGKTQTALEYAYRHLDRYPDGVWWLNAANGLSIATDCRTILVQVGVLNEGQTAELKPEELLYRWQDWLKTHPHRLLIFDDPANPEIIAGYLPPAEQRGHVLLTTRNAAWSGRPTFGLPLLLASDARDLLLKRTGRQERPDTWAKVDEVAQRLGYLPLALEQAAAYMLHTGRSFAEYLKILSDHGLAEIMQRNYAKPDEAYYKEIVTTTWQASFAALEENNRSVNRLFKVFAYTDANNIPLDVFKEHRGVMPEDLQAILTGLQIDDAVVLLRQYSLIERDEKDNDLISIHRLVQEVVRETLKKDADNTFLDCCFNVLYAAVPDEYGSERAARVLFERIAGHGEMAADYYKNVYPYDEKAQIRAASMCFWLGYGYDEIARYVKALELYRKALAISEKVLGTEHPSTASTYNNIGLVYTNQGEYDKALEWYRKALAIKEQVLGTEHPDTASTYNNIASVYQVQGEYDKALEWLRKALAIREKVLGTEHPSTASTYNNIANVYQDQGEYDKALEWYRKALAISEKVLGTEHPSTASTYNNIAIVYRNQGEYDKALEWYRKALAIFANKLGKDHPYTKIVQNNIGAINIKPK